MADYSMSVPTIAETQITGCLGSAIATYRGHTYRADIYRSGIGTMTRDGNALRDSLLLPAPVLAHLKRVIAMLRAG